MGPLNRGGSNSIPSMDLSLEGSGAGLKHRSRECHETLRQSVAQRWLSTGRSRWNEANQNFSARSMKGNPPRPKGTALFAIDIEHTETVEILSEHGSMTVEGK